MSVHVRSPRNVEDKGEGRYTRGPVPDEGEEEVQRQVYNGRVPPEGPGQLNSDFVTVEPILLG